jgi:tRNA 2-thiouridine synthesizing protein A
MAEKVDARGLSCPQPVLMTLSKMKELGAGEIEVIVDNEVSRENVSRAASGQGWNVADIREETDEYRLILKKT